MKKMRAQQGFTLIEIMVVVMIIALMGAIIGPQIFARFNQAQEVRVEQDIRAIEAALQFYRLDNYSYPTQAQGLDALVTAPAGASNWRGPYLDSEPLDPWDQPYYYRRPSTQGEDFDVYTLGADQVEGGEDADSDIGNWMVQ